MYLIAAAERLAVATLQVHLAAIVTAHRLVELSLDPGHPSMGDGNQSCVKFIQGASAVPKWQFSPSKLLETVT
jgi:hypothetical protein